MGKTQTLCRKLQVQNRYRTVEKDQENIEGDQNRMDEARTDDSKEEENGRRERTPRTVLILGGKNVMSLLFTPKHFANFKYYYMKASR